MIFLSICVVLAAIAAMLWLAIAAIDRWHEPRGKLYSLAVFFILAAALTVGAEHASDTPPCAEHAVQSRYDPATKMFRPMKVCVKYGEWVQ